MYETDRSKFIGIAMAVVLMLLGSLYFIFKQRTDIEKNNVLRKERSVKRTDKIREVNRIMHQSPEAALKEIFIFRLQVA